jgi:hypothetical protein
MGRNTHKAPRTMTLTAAFESQESSCARLFEKGPAGSRDRRVLFKFQPINLLRSKHIQEERD